MCLQGASGAGAELLGALPDADLRAQFVWVPMLPPDNEAAALAASQRFAEPRARHHWDGERHLARRMGQALGIGAVDSVAEGDIGLAWDVYLAYGREATQIERPAFWMHQLAVKHAPRLDAQAFRSRVQELLR
jgi:hypothetical protein